jgi:hypothetical protein
MAIYRLLHQQQSAFEPDIVAIMGQAYDDVVNALRLGAGDPLRELIAREVIALTKAGERDPVRLKYLTIQAFRE